MAPAAIAVASVVATAGAAAVSFIGQRRAQRSQDRLADLQRRQENLETSRQTRQQLRERQIAQSQINATAQGQGQLDSSSFFGATSANTANTNRTLGNINQNVELGDQVFAANRSLANAQSLSSIGNGIGQFGNTVGSFVPGGSNSHLISALPKLF